MVGDSLNNKRMRPRGLAGRETPPKLSLGLHTMPQTATGHFKKWLVLALLIFGVIILLALLIFT